MRQSLVVVLIEAVVIRHVGSSTQLDFASSTEG
jgi:hypothetical protein